VMGLFGLGVMLLPNGWIRPERTLFTIQSAIAIVALTGMVVKEAIVLMDCINTHRRAGMQLERALRRAGHQRMRAVFLTTMTTIGGMLTMAIGIPSFSITWSPMATCFVAGLSMSTALTLLVVPVLYLILERWRVWVSGFAHDRLATIRIPRGRGSRDTARDEEEIDEDEEQDEELSEDESAEEARQAESEDEDDDEIARPVAERHHEDEDFVITDDEDTSVVPVVPQPPPVRGAAGRVAPAQPTGNGNSGGKEAPRTVVKQAPPERPVAPHEPERVVDEKKSAKPAIQIRRRRR
jgi:hypothetical protein